MPLPNNLPDEFGDTLSNTLYLPLPVGLGGGLQTQFPPGSDLRLKLTLDHAQSRYMTIPVNRVGNILRADSVSQMAHGHYTFVIKEQHPDIIFCSLSNTVAGHTTVSNGATALYAGETTIVNGRMIHWSNNSGHYQPPEDRKLRNIHSTLRDVLPVRLFSEYG
jgi:hypothetical protein